MSHDDSWLLTAIEQSISSDKRFNLFLVSSGFFIFIYLYLQQYLQKTLYLSTYFSCLDWIQNRISGQILFDVIDKLFLMFRFNSKSNYLISFFFNFSKLYGTCSMIFYVDFDNINQQNLYFSEIFLKIRLSAKMNWVLFETGLFFSNLT